jgi:hypothetical protein
VTKNSSRGANDARDVFVEAANSDALCASLRRVNITVPARTAGRTTRHTETWTISHLLATLAVAGRLSYPLSAYRRDKPDILLNNAGVEIGVEITEAISRQYAAYCALAEREFPGVFLGPAHFCWGAPDLSVDDMRALLRESQLTSDGWIGERPEQEWALFIQSVFDTKLTKLQRADFIKYTRNWLSVYDNLPLPNIDLEKAVTFLRPLIRDYWMRTPSFDALFVEHGAVVVAITADRAEHLMLNDLWD